MLKKVVGLMVCLVSVGVLFAAPAFAREGNFDLSNGCDVHWSNSKSSSSATATTQERQDCAALQVQIFYQDSVLGSHEITTAYVPSSSVMITTPSLGFIQAFYSDHNGKHTTNGTAYGFRQSF